MSLDATRTAVIGGGFTGLVLAYRLSRLGHRVTVYEQGPQLGGLATWHDFGGFFWDRFYHVILPSDQALIDLITEIGLGNDLFWGHSRTAYFTEGRFHPFNTPLDLLRFPILGWLDKLRLGLGLVYGARGDQIEALDQLTAEDWLLRVFGRRIYDRFWLPLLRAKLGDAYRRVSAVFIWTYLRRLRSARDTSAHDRLGHVKGGYHAILSTLAEKIEQADGMLRYPLAVRSIAPAAPSLHEPQLDLTTEDGKVTRFDRVIFTGPLQRLSAVADKSLVELDPAPIEYLGVVCLVLITRRSLVPYYVTNLADASFPFTGVIGLSSIVPPACTDGYHLTYFPRYVSSTDPLLRAPDRELSTQFLRSVKRLLPDAADDANIVSVHLQRASHVQPLQTVGFASRVPRIETRHPGFHVLNTSQFTDSTLNNNAVVRHVERFLGNLGT